MGGTTSSRRTVRTKTARPAPASDAAPAADAARASKLPRARRYEVEFPRNSIDPDVLKVLRRLVGYGHEAYLVGGCVRDLLLRREPKDFDVATSARPEEVRGLFRNSRIIGRRFRLVHVMFHRRNLIEVATFRRNPRPSSDGELIRSDNAFGSAAEDAQRRDFTINGLFFDAERNQIRDWVEGMRDIRAKVIRTIGDPETRLREDPVRILRAIKFAGRLNLGLDPALYEAIVYTREDLQLAARPRVAEEILRLMRGGQARRSLYIAWETGVLDVLLPELAALLYDADGDDTPGARVWKQLSFIDKRHFEGRPVDDTVLWALLLLESMKEACEGQADRIGAVSEMLDVFSDRLAITRRSADGLRRIMSGLPRIEAGKPGRMARSETFDLALDVAEADCLSQGRPPDTIHKLRAIARPPRAGRSRRR